jgi:uncharacterized BrkB/YihY/UPF0761 family membrane protein
MRGRLDNWQLPVWWRLWLLRLLWSLFLLLLLLLLLLLPSLPRAIHKSSARSGTRAGNRWSTIRPRWRYSSSSLLWCVASRSIEAFLPRRTS